MNIRCPKCKAALQIADPVDAVQITCSGCGAVLRVRPRGQGGGTCPACGKPVAADAAVCVKCGLNLKTGAAAQTSIEDEEEPDEEAPPSLPIRVLVFIAEWMPGLLRPRIVILSIVVGLIGLGILAFGLALFAFGALITCFAAGAMGVIIYAQAVAWLLDGELCWLVEALTNLEGPRWALFFALLLFPFVAIFLLIRLLVAPG